MHGNIFLFNVNVCAVSERWLCHSLKVYQRLSKDDV